jgi:hypothetical protein
VDLAIDYTLLAPVRAIYNALFSNDQQVGGAWALQPGAGSVALPSSQPASQPHDPSASAAGRD